MNITKKEWYAYRRVQSGGKFNMLTPQAEASSGLDKKMYWYILDRYDLLADKFEKSEKSSN